MGFDARTFSTGTRGVQQRRPEGMRTFFDLSNDRFASLQRTWPES